MTPDTTYSQKRTFVIQESGGNILVRGNLPLKDDGSFAYLDLNNRLQKLISRNFDLKKYTLIDISLIDNQGEQPDLLDEFTAFGVANLIPTVWPPVVKGVDIFKEYGSSVCGNPGHLMWMPIQGCSDETNCNLVENTQYNFSGIVDQLNTQMTTGTGKVIYYHCMNGHDRAGSLTACYMMKYMGRTRQQAMYSNPPEGAMAMGHDWKETYKPLIEWYAGSINK